MNSDTTYTKYRAIGHLLYRPSNRKQSPIHQVSPQARPVEVALLDNGMWQLQGMIHQVLLPQTSLQSSMASFSRYISTLTPWEVDLLNTTRMETDPRDLCFALESSFRAVSDGSVRQNAYSSFGWVLSSRSGDRLAYGMGPASGRTPTSY